MSCTSSVPDSLKSALHRVVMWMVTLPVMVSALVPSVPRPAAGYH